MANKETRILKSNTLEVLRQKTNEVSLHLGDNELLDSNITDKTFNYNNVSVGSAVFQGTDDTTVKTVSFEVKPEESLDNTGGYIILKGSRTVPASFAADANITQTGGFSGTIVSVSDEKILVKNTTGTFNSSQQVTVGSDNIAAGSIVRIIAESYSVGVVRVYLNNVELNQNLEASGFHVPSLSGKINLLNSPTVTDFVEGSTIYQGTDLASATFSGTILRTTSAEMLLKNHTGTFSASVQIKLDGSSSTITGVNHSDLTNIDTSSGAAIELNTPTTSATDDIRIFSSNVIEAINELQDDVGVTENLATTATNLVGAINEIESVFDASTHEISAGANAFEVTSGQLTLDSSANIILDADGGDVELKDGGALYGRLTNSGNNNIVIKSGSTTMLTGSGANAIFNNDLTIERDLDVDRNLNVDGTTTLDGTTIDGNLDLNGTLDVSSNATVNGNTILVGNLNTRGNNNLGNDTGDDTTISGDLTVNVNATVTGATQLNGGLTMDTNKFVVANGTGNTSIAGTLDVDGATTLDGTTIDGDLDLNGSVDVSTNAVIHGTLDVDGNTTLDGTTIDGNLDLNGSADISTNLTVGGVVDIGQLSAQFTNRNNVKLALNELHSELGNAVITGTGTAAAGLTNITAAVNAIDAEIGTVASYESGTYGATTISGVLTNLQTGVISNDTDITNLFADVGSLSLTDNLPSDYTYTTTDLTTATNTMSAFIGNTSIANIGTTDTVTGALQKLHAEIGDSNLSVFAATDISAALRELESEKIYLSSTSVQEITSRLGLTGNVTFKDGGTNSDTFTFNSGTTLDLSNASLLLPGNASNVNIFSTSFLEVDGNVETPMGFSVDRQHVTQTDKTDVRIQWNENHTDGTSASKPARGWQLRGLNDGASSETADIVTFYNAKELITSNTESGISVTWDSSAQNFDFNVNDPTVQLSGDVSGSAVMTNLGSIDIATVIQPNSVALGTDTTGNYIETLTGTTYQVTVTPAGHSEGKDATLSIPSDFRMPGTAKVLSTAGSSSATTGALTVAGGVGIGEDLYIAGDLYVEGTRTELNVTTLEVEDTLVLAGNGLSSEPSSGGFGLEVGPITSPSGVASGVTGAHSIVYNYSNDRWEADGSLILSEATLASPGLEVNGSDIGTLSGSKTLDLKAGTGIGLSSNVNGDDFEITINNTLDGYSGWFLSTQGTNRGNIADDERVDFHGGTALTASYDTTNTNRVIFNHDNVGPGAQTFGRSGSEDGTYIKSVTINNQGHVTAVTSDDFDDRYDNYSSWTIRDGDTTTYPITSGDTLQITGGAGLTSNFTADDVLEIKHNDTSSVSNLSQNNSGNTFIQDLALTFDTFGHVTGATASTGTVSVGNGTLTLEGGGGIVTTIGDFTANQSNNETLTISHADTSSASSSNNSGRTYIQDITIDTYGHVTGIGTATETYSYTHPTYNGDDINIDTGALTGATVISDLDFNITTDSIGSVVDANGTVSTRNLTLADLGYTGATNADNYGSWQLYVNNVSQDSITSGERVGFDEGSAIDLSWDGNDITISHQDTSSVANVNGSGNTFIQDITFDTFGHVTAVGTGTVSVGNGQIDGRTSGLGLSGSMDATANQSGNTTFTVTSNATTASTASTLAYRDGSGDIHARLFRSEYDTTNSNIGFIMTQVNTASDNYIRPSTAAQIRSFLNVADGANNSSADTGTPAILSNGSTPSLNSGISAAEIRSLIGAGTSSFNGAYSSLSGTPTIPSNNNQLTNGAGYTTYSSNQATNNSSNVHFEGLMVGQTSGVAANTIRCVGDIVAYYSDDRLKNRIGNIENALDKVNQLNGFTFTANETAINLGVEADSDRVRVGVSAQEVESVLPEAVTDAPVNNDEGYKTVQYEKMVPLLIEAIKELTEENKLIRSELEALKDINS